MMGNELGVGTIPMQNNVGNLELIDSIFFTKLHFFIINSFTYLSVTPIQSTRMPIGLFSIPITSKKLCCLSNQSVTIEHLS